LFLQVEVRVLQGVDTAVVAVVVDEGAAALGIRIGLFDVAVVKVV